MTNKDVLLEMMRYEYCPLEDEAMASLILQLLHRVSALEEIVRHHGLDEIQ